MIADFLPVLLQVLLWVLQTLLVLLGAVMAVLVAFVVLPIVVRVEAGRGPESDATPDVDAVVAPWFGTLAVGVRQVVDGWEGRLLLLGRLCLYRRLVYPPVARRALQDLSHRSGPSLSRFVRGFCCVLFGAVFLADELLDLIDGLGH